MAAVPTVDLGVFAVGEKPEPLEYQFQDETGDPKSIGGWTAKVVVWEDWGEPATYDATVSDGPAGKVVFNWNSPTHWPTPGHWHARFWVGDGSQRFGSVRLDWTAEAVRGPAPAI